MNAGSQAGDEFYLGWDVGGWNCDRNRDSRDAIVVLDSRLALRGKPWRGNLREYINRARNAREWLNCLFELCGLECPATLASVVMAVDTPLGFSRQFAKLVCDLRNVDSVDTSATNQYLFRQTERFLYQRGFKPLSGVKDMIGSQATKGMHVLAKFARTVDECGVWRSGEVLTAIEAYPSACRLSPSLRELRKRANRKSLDHQDKDDALTCALVAYLFARNKTSLISPPVDVPKSEGWIWMPRDAQRAAE